jgi:hypothetical protein
MADGVHLAMNRMQPTGGRTMANPSTAEAKTEQLGPRDHSMLAFRDFPDSSFASPWVASCTYVVR